MDDEASLIELNFKLRCISGFNYLLKDWFEIFHPENLPRSQPLQVCQFRKCQKDLSEKPRLIWIHAKVFNFDLFQSEPKLICGKYLYWWQFLCEIIVAFVGFQLSYPFCCRLIKKLDDAWFEGEVRISTSPIFLEGNGRRLKSGFERLKNGTGVSATLSLWTFQLWLNFGNSLLDTNH